MYKNKTLICIECGKEFIFEGWEQEVYKSKGTLEYGKFCLECRKAKNFNLSEEYKNIVECLNYRLPRITTLRYYQDMIVQ